MGRTTVFNGIELTIPDAYSALDVSRLLTPTSGGVGIVGLVGEAEDGRPGLTIIPGGSSPNVVKNIFKNGPLANMCRLALRSGVDNLVQGGASTILAFKTNNSTPSTLQAGGLAAAIAEIVRLTAIADVGGALDQAYFVLPLNATDTVGFWIDVDDSGSTIPAGLTALSPTSTVEITTIATNDLVAAVKSKLIAAIDAVVGLGAADAGGDDIDVTLVFEGAVPAFNDGSGEFSLTQQQAGVDADTSGSIIFTTKKYGEHTKLYTGGITTVGSEKFVTIRDENGIPETSPGLGLTSYMAIQYTGDASTAVVGLSWVGSTLKLVVTLAGDQTDGSADIDLDVTTLTLGQIAQTINLLTGYTVTVAQEWSQFLASDLDLILTPVDVKTAEVGMKASIKELIDWGETTSTLVTVARGALNEGDTVPGTLATTNFAGGTRGTTTNTDVQNALNELLKVRMNIVVPLFSSDNQDGSTVTIESVNSIVKDHVVNRSGLLGRSECQAYVSIKGNKDAFKAECSRMNSRWVAVTSQIVDDLDIDGVLTTYPEYAFAVVCAQTQAGSPIGTDLTYKQLPISGLTQDVSWSPAVNGPELIKAGALIGGPDENNVNRIIAGYTSSLGDTNNANIYIETVESLAIFAFNNRQFMKQRFLGISDFTAQDVIDALVESLEFERDVSRSIKGFDLDLLKIISVSAGRLEYDIAVVPFEGIKFVLPTVVAIRE